MVLIINIIKYISEKERNKQREKKREGGKQRSM